MHKYTFIDEGDNSILRTITRKKPLTNIEAEVLIQEVEDRTGAFVLLDEEVIV